MILKMQEHQKDNGISDDQRIADGLIACQRAQHVVAVFGHDVVDQQGVFLQDLVDLRVE